MATGLQAIRKREATVKSIEHAGTSRVEGRTSRVWLTAVALLSLVATFAVRPPGASAAALPAWEIGVVAAPTSFAPADVEPEVLRLYVNATGGTFTLKFEEETTAALPFDASDSEVRAAIEALPFVQTAGAGVEVTGGPGDAGAHTSYRVAVVGNLAGHELVNVEGLGAELTGSSPGLPPVRVERAFSGRFGDRYTVSIANVGGLASEGLVTVTDELPVGLTPEAPFSPDGSWNCTVAGQSVTCTTETPVASATQAGAIIIPVASAPSATGTLTNRVEISGGGAAPCGGAGQSQCAAASTATTIGAPPTGIAPLGFRANAFEPSGLVDTRAAAHPTALTTSFDLPTAIGEHELIHVAYPVESVKQVVVDQPAGLIGDARATPTCSLADLTDEGSCPLASEVGLLELREPPPPAWAGVENRLPIFNITPEDGHPAEFGVYLPVIQRYSLLYASVRPSDYGVRITSQPLPRAIPISGVSTIFFGDPGFSTGAGSSGTAFLTNSSDCSATGFTTSIHVDSWQHPGSVDSEGTPDLSDPNWKGASVANPPVTNCNALAFSPELSLQTTTTLGNAPTGLNTVLRVPQVESPGDLATPPVKDVVVSLPRGLTINPSSANGLEACSDSQIALGSSSPAACPPASAIGSVTVNTALLQTPLTGRVYLGAPECDPCTDAKSDGPSGRLLRLYIVAEGSGVVLKLPGSVAVDSATGQLTASFRNNPQQPFDELKVRFNEGARAPLSTPEDCGNYALSAVVSPWSSPFSPDASMTSNAAVTSCPLETTFAPGFVAGTGNPRAGAFAPFSVNLSRNDADQQFARVTVSLPPGLLAKVAGVPLCNDSDASAGSCPAASRVGSVTSSAGTGAQPVSLSGGAYLTGPYKGAPYGLAIEVPAIAGPFNLGRVVVRQALTIDPHDAHVTDVSDPFPTRLDGIPLEIRSVSVVLDRPDFTKNPTSCAPATITGTLLSLRSRTSTTGSRFQAADCAALPFHPAFSATTAGSGNFHGASLDVKIAQKPGEAAIRKVDTQLPFALPSRLVTLQKACTEAQFAANPAGCPAGSVVGVAKGISPLLNVPLTGPAYLVSHGGAAFPDLDIILQGEGVTIDLVGNTDIKKGITFSRFETVPDAPISSFELNLPGGPGAVLAAIKNLCAPTKIVTVTKHVSRRVRGRIKHVTVKVKRKVPEPLVMPTSITGQNGAEVKQNTKIAVSGCKRAKPKKKAKAKKAHKSLRTKRK